MRNRVELLIKKIFNNAKNENNLVVIEDPNFGKSIEFHSVFFNKTQGISNSTNSNIPVINIPDYNLFVDCLTEYVTEAIKFYRHDYLGLDSRFLAEKLIYDLFGNVTAPDFNNIIPYIKHRTAMLKTTLKKGVFELGQFKEYQLLGAVDSIGSEYEAPYKFLAAFDDEYGGRFKLPAILFGIDGDNVYIYAIQNTAATEKLSPEKIEQNKSIKKNLNRFFRKVNLNVDENDCISKVSPNFLVVLTIFASYMRQLGKKQIIAPFYFPIRYDANKLHHTSLMKTETEIEAYIEKHDNDYFNVVNKFAYLFLRYNHHFPNCTAEYDENRNQIITKLEKTHPIDKNIIYDIDAIVSLNMANQIERQ